METTSKKVELNIILGSLTEVVVRSVRLDGSLEYVIYKGYRYYLRTLPMITSGSPTKHGCSAAYDLFTVDSPFQPHPVGQPFPLHK